MVLDTPVRSVVCCPVQYYVYIWENLVNGKLYVGKGQRRRALTHVSNAKAGRGYLLASAMRKYGAENFKLTYLFQGLTSSEASGLEIAAIASRGCMAPAGYNLTLGGEGTPGCLASPETRERLSLSHRGKKQPQEQIEKRVLSMRGQKRSPEVRAKMSEAQQKRSPETRAKLSAALTGKKLPPERVANMSKPTGKPLSPETRAKLSAALKGRPKSDEMRAKLSASRTGTKMVDGTWVPHPDKAPADD